MRKPNEIVNSIINQCQNFMFAGNLDTEALVDEVVSKVENKLKNELIFNEAVNLEEAIELLIAYHPKLDHSNKEANYFKLLRNKAHALDELEIDGRDFIITFETETSLDKETMELIVKSCVNPRYRMSPEDVCDLQTRLSFQIASSIITSEHVRGNDVDLSRLLNLLDEVKTKLNEF
jgi:hypothetical protein